MREITKVCIEDHSTAIVVKRGEKGVEKIEVSYINNYPIIMVYSKNNHQVDHIYALNGIVTIRYEGEENYE